MLSLLLRKRTVSTKAALKLLDDANAAIHYNREILQTALDHVRQGIAVFDKDLQLICWNRQSNTRFFLLPGAPRLIVLLIVELIEAEGVTVTAGVPTLYAKLLQQLEANGRGAGTFQRIVVAG